jgi:hypothetical protein
MGVDPSWVYCHHHGPYSYYPTAVWTLSAFEVQVCAELATREISKLRCVISVVNQTLSPPIYSLTPVIDAASSRSECAFSRATLRFCVRLRTCPLPPPSQFSTRRLPARIPITDARLRHFLATCIVYMDFLFVLLILGIE